jgi:hypothetical protein
MAVLMVFMVLYLPSLKMPSTIPCPQGFNEKLDICSVGWTIHEDLAKMRATWYM